MKLKKLSWPLILSVVVVALSGRATSLIDSHGGPLSSTVARLALPQWYVITSPVSRGLDAITLLSVPQTIWMFAALALIILTFSARSLKQLALRLAGIIIMVAIIEAAVIALPRPAARLEAANPDVVRIDFHSHSNASRDANKRFSPEDNRNWHSAGGFDVAYITDHVRFQGAADAMRKNPVRSGDSLVVFSGIEGRYHRIFSTILLGLTEQDSAAIDSKGHLLERAAELGIDPVNIVAIPNRNLDSIFPDSLPHFSALELVDAAPRGLGQLDREEARLRAVAAKHNLVLVSGSNNHGWGNTVASWNLMRIPGWRNLSPDTLRLRIEEPIRERRSDAVAVVRRLRPATHGAMLPFTLPVAAYQIVASLTMAERLSWLAWIWIITALVLMTRGSRRARV